MIIKRSKTTIVFLNFFLYKVFKQDSSLILKYTSFYIGVAFFLTLVGYVQLFVYGKYKEVWAYLSSRFIPSSKTIFFSLLSISAVLIFVGLGTNHLIPWDEAIYAKISKNIVQRGISKAKKPPLYMWVSAIFMSLFGFQEWTVRILSAVSGLLSVVLVYVLTKRFFGRVAGFIAGFSLLTTFQFLYYARIGMLDVTCSSFILLSLYFYSRVKVYAQAVGKKKMLFLGISGISLGLAVMTKGVVGLIPLAVCVLYETISGVIEQRLRFSNYYALLIIFAFSLPVFLPWHILMYIKYGKEFINSYLLYHVIDRATEAIEDKGRPFFWYITVLKVSMRLWFVVLIPAVVFWVWSFVKNKAKRPILLFIGIWAITVFLMFSISKSKLIWYIMPIYPALAIIVGYFSSFMVHKLNALSERFLKLKGVYVKFLFMYICVVVSFLYIVQNKNLAYPSDLTGSQAELILLKNDVFNKGQVLYADRVELPLLYYYSEGPFEQVDFGPLALKLKDNAKNHEQLVFITKESRFRKYKETYPTLNLVQQTKEWVLGELPGNVR